MNEIYEIANSHNACIFSTVEDNQPRSRIMLMWFADETGFYFHTGKNKRIYKQIIDNPKVELLFYPLNSKADKIMLRVSGEIEMVEGLMDRLNEERPATKEFRDEMVIFRVVRGEAYFWTMADNGHERDIEVFKF